MNTTPTGNLKQSPVAEDSRATPADSTSIEKILKFQKKSNLGSMVRSAKLMPRYGHVLGI